MLTIGSKPAKQISASIEICARRADRKGPSGRGRWTRVPPVKFCVKKRAFAQLSRRVRRRSAPVETICRGIRTNQRSFMLILSLN